MKNHVTAMMAGLAAIAILLNGCAKDDPASDPEKYVARTSFTLSSSNGNFPCGGTVATDNTDATSSTEVVKMVDNSPLTYYHTSMPSVNVVYVASEAFPVGTLSLMCSAFMGYDPVSFVLYGSEDGSGWEQICAEEELYFSFRRQELSWTVDAEKEFRYYKLVMGAAQGAEGIRVSEWKMTKRKPSADREIIDFSDLMSYAGGRTFSEVTPMGKKFGNNLRTATLEQMEWLNDPTQNPPIEAATLNAENYMLKALDVNLYPYGDPSPADVNQHAIGDCCACAVFAAFAYTRPGFIKSIISQEGNVFTVKMFNPAGEPITVKVDNKFICGLKGKLQALSGKGQIATWSTVLEKAMMKWQYVYRYNYGIGGIGTEHVVPLFTGDGDSFAFSAGKLSPQQLERAVKGSLSQGYIVIGGFTKSDVIVENTYKSVSGHAFSLMCPNSASGLFAMRNPWGGAAGSPDGKEDGVMNIPDNRAITDMIDLRICYPGSSLEYFEGAEAYYPPKFSSSPYGLWNSPAEDIL